MIRNKYLIPECYVAPIPICDECNCELERQNVQYLTDPVLFVYKCPKCNKEYTFREDEVTGHWKWRTI